MKIRVISTVVTAAVLMFTGCSQSVSHTEDDGEQNSRALAALEYLADKGFDTTGALIEDENVVVEGCIEFHINDLENDTHNQTRQYKHSRIVSQDNVANIRVKYESNVPSVWQSASDAALTEWNNIYGSKVTLTKVNSGEDLTIYYENLNDSTVGARATFPSSTGEVGYRIRINTVHDGLPSSMQKFIMVHEIGHCLGMRHINNNESDRTQIDGTPVTDDNSVMRPVADYWNGFSQYDVIAAEVVYPDSAALAERQAAVNAAQKAAKKAQKAAKEAVEAAQKAIDDAVKNLFGW